MPEWRPVIASDGLHHRNEPLHRSCEFDSHESGDVGSPLATHHAQNSRNRRRSCRTARKSVRQSLALVTLGEVARTSMILDPDGNWIELSRRASVVGSFVRCAPGRDVVPSLFEANAGQPLARLPGPRCGSTIFCPRHDPGRPGRTFQLTDTARSVKSTRFDVLRCCSEQDR
jgi:hypothetical protein